MYKAKRGEAYFSEFDVFDLLRQTQSDVKLAALVQSIRLVPGMKNSAEKMQRILFEDSSPSIHRWMNEVWLSAGETPQGVYNILRLDQKRLQDSPAFLPPIYRELQGQSGGKRLLGAKKKTGFLAGGKTTDPGNRDGEVIPVSQGDSGPEKSWRQLGDAFVPGVEWMTTVEFEPEDVARWLRLRNSVSKLSKSDPRYTILEPYTLQYAADKSGTKTLEKVKELLVANDLNAALIVAMKAR